jgi:hypothetical protein
MHGTVVISPSGAFIYTPGVNFTGYDKFFFSVRDTLHNPVIGEAIIGVSPQLPLPALALPTLAMLTPVIVIRPKAVSLNSPWQSVSFPVEVSPQAKTGDTYRLTVRQQAADCEGNFFYKSDCFDIVIGACR